MKARHPELCSRRFLLRTAQARPLDTLVRLDVRLSDGSPCFRGTAVVERVQEAADGEPGMFLWLMAMDDAGRELIAWMGGKPPPPLKESAEPAPATPAATPLRPAGQAAQTIVTEQEDDGGDLVDPFAAFEAAAAAADRVAAAAAAARPGPPRPQRDAAASGGFALAPPDEEGPAGTPLSVDELSLEPEADFGGPAVLATPAPEVPPPTAPSAAPAAPKAPPPPPASPLPSATERLPTPPSVAPQRLGAVQIVSRAAARPAPPGSPPARATEPPAAAVVLTPPAPAVAPPAAPAVPVVLTPPATAVEPPPAAAVILTPPAEPARRPELPVAAPPPAAGGHVADAPPPPEPPAGSVKPAAAPSPAPPAPAQRGKPSHPPPSRRPAPPPLPRPTLTPGVQAEAAAPPPAEVDEAPPPRPAGDKKGPIIGIDLGTTNSCAAVVKEGKAFIIPSREGYNTIPSVVALSDKGAKVLVGHPARGQMLINPKNTVFGAKRLIGRQFKSPIVSDLLGRFAYEIVAGPRGEAAVKLSGKVFSLQKISSLVLAEVKHLAQQWLGTEITRAVITVPAYYNDNQRQAVRAAGALAGFDVERILNEPTAAAIAFAHGRRLEQRVMVYDLGGGTFDTSVLELHGNVYEVISTGGDTFLGGVDFDKALVADLLERFKEKNGIEFRGDRVALQRISDAAERAKIWLSERLTAQVNVPFVTLSGDRPYDLDATVTRAELEKLTEQLVDRTLRVCDEVLTNCGLKPKDIGEVLLVGGQSRMPLVREKIRQFFGREPSKSVHPDEAVALGAALLAESIHSGEIGGMVLVDVLPMSIGVGLPGGRFKKVVERNTSLPHKKTYSIWTSEDDQETLEIPVFQGEHDRAQDNEYLGTLIVPDLPPGTKGNVVFDIIFSISAESILTVTAEERGTARSVSATFSTQDTPESVRRKLKGSSGVEPPRLDEDERPGVFGWVKRVFGTRAGT